MPQLRFALLLFVAALFQSTTAGALVKFDFEQKFFNEPGEEVLDHYILEEDGVYHLFYLRGNPALDVGHATSTDLVHWNYEPPVLTPGTWDAKLWAPHLFRHPNGHWLMYFTGASAVHSQQTGVAFSNNLYDWFKFPDPIYHPDPVWAEWTTEYFAHGRDPHVIEHDGKYYLFNTAKTWTNQGAVACAVSPDMFNWTDIGPVYVHYTWHVMESIFVMERNSKFHMFFTEQVVNGTSHMASDSLLSGWDIIANRRIIDTGHAPQVSTLSDGTEIFSRHFIYNDNRGTQLYTLRLDTLRWSGDIPYPWKPWGMSRDWTVVDGYAFAYQPTYLNNPYARFEDVETTFEGNCWIGTKERYSGPSGIGAPGGVIGDASLGTARSKTFTITGYSMTLLVGGSDDIDNCYVALIDADTDEVLLKETGRGVEELDERAWDLFALVGRDVYIEIADKSDAGHINVDYIVEKAEPIADRQGDGRTDRRPDWSAVTASVAAKTLTNTPNPFNPTTTISFELDRPARATLDVYDVSGAFVTRLISGDLAAGVHTSSWNGTDAGGSSMASGIYFYRLVVDGEVVATRKMALLK